MLSRVKTQNTETCKRQYKHSPDTFKKPKASKIASKIKHYNFPMRKLFKSTDLSHPVNNDNEPAETTSPGNMAECFTLDPARQPHSLYTQ